MVVKVCLMKKDSYPMRLVDQCVAPTGMLIGVPRRLHQPSPHPDPAAILVLLKRAIPPPVLDPMKVRCTGALWGNKMHRYTILFYFNKGLNMQCVVYIIIQ